MRLFQILTAGISSLLGRLLTPLPHLSVGVSILQCVCQGPGTFWKGLSGGRDEGCRFSRGPDASFSPRSICPGSRSCLSPAVGPVSSLRSVLRFRGSDWGLPTDRPPAGLTHDHSLPLSKLHRVRMVWLSRAAQGPDQLTPPPPRVITQTPSG